MKGLIRKIEQDLKELRAKQNATNFEAKWKIYQMKIDGLERDLTLYQNAEIGIMPPSVVAESDPDAGWAKYTDEQMIEFSIVPPNQKKLKDCKPFSFTERVVVKVHNNWDADFIQRYNGKEARVLAAYMSKSARVVKKYLVRFDNGMTHSANLEDLTHTKKISTPSVSEPTKLEKDFGWNEHGVATKPKIITIYNGKNQSINVSLAQIPSSGKWSFGFSIDDKNQGISTPVTKDGVFDTEFEAFSKGLIVVCNQKQYEVVAKAKAYLDNMIKAETKKIELEIG